MHEKRKLGRRDLLTYTEKMTEHFHSYFVVVNLPERCFNPSLLNHWQIKNSFTLQKPGLKQANTSISHDSLFQPFFARLGSFLRIQGWQNNRETIREYGIRGMSYFRTSVPCWEHQVILHQYFSFANTRIAKKKGKLTPLYIKGMPHFWTHVPFLEQQVPSY